jgi:hypothetical protein
VDSEAVETGPANLHDLGSSSEFSRLTVNTQVIWDSEVLYSAGDLILVLNHTFGEGEVIGFDEDKVYFTVNIGIFLVD